jgi:hypothetical protein
MNGLCVLGNNCLANWDSVGEQPNRPIGPNTVYDSMPVLAKDDFQFQYDPPFPSKEQGGRVAGAVVRPVPQLRWDGIEYICVRVEAPWCSETAYCGWHCDARYRNVRPQIVLSGVVMSIHALPNADSVMAHEQQHVAATWDAAETMVFEVSMLVGTGVDCLDKAARALARLDLEEQRDRVAEGGAEELEERTRQIDGNNGAKR